VSGNGGAVLFTIAAGLAGAVQAAVNATLGKRIGTLEAAAFQTIVAVLIFMVILLAVRRSFGGLEAGLQQPAWLWLGGVMGVIIISAITFAPNRIGVLAFAAILIAGQLVASAVFDHFGFFGLDRIAFTWERGIGFALLAGGAALILRF
jgi:bacterial/archaeal transporter family-2 protein